MRAISIDDEDLYMCLSIVRDRLEDHMSEGMWMQTGNLARLCGYIDYWLDKRDGKIAKPE